MTSKTRFYRPELDALRFFAFLCVFAFHRMDYVAIDPATQPVSYAIGTAGAFGVPVFFLLSSFLIVELLLRERKQTGSIHIRSFYMRRILRIWPLYFASFFGLVALGHFLPNVGPKTYGSWAAFLLFAGNWYIVRHGWIAGPIDPLWSIAVEEQFYIAVPLLARFGGRKLLGILSFVLIVVSYLTSVHYARLVYSGESGQWVNSWFQFQFFAAGALLAMALHGRVPRWPMGLRAIAFLAAAGCWLYAVMGPGVKSYDAHTTVAGAIGGWLLVLLGSAVFFLATLGIPERYVPRWLDLSGPHFVRAVHLPFVDVLSGLRSRRALAAAEYGVAARSGKPGAVDRDDAGARVEYRQRRSFLSLLREAISQAERALHLRAIEAGVADAPAGSVPQLPYPDCGRVEWCAECVPEGTLYRVRT